MDTSDDPDKRNVFGFIPVGPTDEAKTARHSERAADALAAQTISEGPGATASTASGDVFSPERRRRRQQAGASVLTRDWLPPTLGMTGLLGLG